jgi:hypothetical protein
MFLLEPEGAARTRFWPWMTPVLLFAAVASFCNVRSPDLWWHLKTGEWIWQNRAVPHSDVFSYTAAGQPWISHEWLFGLLSYGLHYATGIEGVVTAKAILVVLILALSARVCRLRGAPPGVTTLILAGAYAVSRMRFTERPELLSIPLAIVFLLAYERSRTKPVFLAFLPAAQLLWVNLHGGTALLGWVLAGAILLDRAWELRRAEGNFAGLARKEFRGYAATVAGVLAASFLNPHGYKALFYGLLRTESPLENKEFQSLAALMRGGIDLSMVLFIGFSALLALIFALRPSRVRMYEWLLFPSLFALTVVFFRFRPLFVFLLGPSLACGLPSLGFLRRVRPWVPLVAAALLLGHVAELESRTSFYRFGAEIHPAVFPGKAVDFLKRAGIGGNMFNSYGIGGYLIWRLGPQQRVFIDGREDVYLGPGVLAEYVHAFDSRQKWVALVEKYDIDYAIVQYPEQPPSRPDNSLDSMAFPRSEWGLVHFDDSVMVYVRRNGRNDAVLKQEIRMVQPAQVSTYLDTFARDPARLELFRAEMAENAKENPESFRNHFTLGLLAIKLGPAHLAEALDHFRRAAEINPDFAPAHTNAGTIYMHMGRREEARAAFERSLSIEPNSFVSAQLEKLR